MPEMICTKRHTYAGRELSEGDRFAVEQRHVVIELGLGRAVLAEHHEEVCGMTAGVDYNRRDIPFAPKRKRGRPRKAS
jgi:hypothetical protein